MTSREKIKLVFDEMGNVVVGQSRPIRVMIYGGEAFTIETAQAFFRPEPQKTIIVLRDGAYGIIGQALGHSKLPVAAEPVEQLVGAALLSKNGR